MTAHPAITSEHATTSSAESETYALALFANDLLALSYVVDEAGLGFPRPAVVQVDNTAAIAFSRSTGSNGRSRMRHIDLRQAWVRVEFAQWHTQWQLRSSARRRIVPDTGSSLASRRVGAGRH